MVKKSQILLMGLLFLAIASNVSAYKLLQNIIRLVFPNNNREKLSDRDALRRRVERALPSQTRPLVVHAVVASALEAAEAGDKDGVEVFIKKWLEAYIVD